MSNVDAFEAQIESFRADFNALRQQLARVLVGQHEVVEGTLTALIAGGHVLLEGPPGLGKTLLVRTLAAALAVEFRRIQFTLDLMPADIIGTYVIMESHGRRQFEFQQGPIFTNLLLADEINRATPKTQAALLEGMQEYGVTVANTTYDLPEPFFVLATQSPADAEGTFPLPETQLDRFFFKLKMAFPTAEELEVILDRTTESAEPVAQKVLSGKRIHEMSQLVRQVPIGKDVRGFAIALVMATHPLHELAAPMVRRFVARGSSPRGAQAMILAAKLHAMIDGRLNASRDDVREVALSALRHRLVLNFDGHAEQIDPDSILTEILNSPATKSADQAAG
jgi:MoxR-like ATPase